MIRGDEHQKEGKSEVKRKPFGVKMKIEEASVRTACIKLPSKVKKVTGIMVLTRPCLHVVDYWYAGVAGSEERDYLQLTQGFKANEYPEESFSKVYFVEEGQRLYFIQPLDKKDYWVELQGELSAPLYYVATIYMKDSSTGRDVPYCVLQSDEWVGSVTMNINAV